MEESNAELSLSVNLKCSFIYTFLNNYFKPDPNHPTGQPGGKGNQLFSIVDQDSRSEIGSITLKFVHAAGPRDGNQSEPLININVHGTDLSRNRNEPKMETINQNDLRMTQEFVKISTSNYGSTFCSSNANQPLNFAHNSTDNQPRASVIASNSDTKSFNPGPSSSLLNSFPNSNHVHPNNVADSLNAGESGSGDSTNQPQSNTENPAVMYLSNSPNGEFSCSYCAYKSPKRNLVRLHFYNNHRNLFLHCFYCSYANRQRKMLQYHYWNVHRLDMETSKALLRKTKFKETRNSAPAISRENDRRANNTTTNFPKSNPSSSNLPFPLVSFLPNLDAGLTEARQNFMPVGGCFRRDNFNG